MARPGRWLGGAVGLLAAAVVVAELAAPGLAASSIESAVADETGGRITVTAEVSGPPLVLPGLATGRVDRVEVALDGIAGTPAPVHVGITMTGVTVDRRALLRADIELVAVERSEATVAADLAEVVPDLLEPLAGRLVDAGLERLVDEVGPSLGLRADGDRLVLGDDLTLGLEGGLAGCDLTADGLEVTVRCGLTDPPELLLRALS